MRGLLVLEINGVKLGRETKSYTSKDMERFKLFKSKKKEINYIFYFKPSNLVNINLLNS